MMLQPTASPAAAPDVSHQVQEIGRQLQSLTDQVTALGAGAEPAAAAVTRLDIFHGYMGVFVAAFLVTLLATPLMRRLALANGVIDRPGVSRKIHRVPIAYLGGAAVYLGLLAGILFVYTAPYHHLVEFHKTARVEVGLPGAVPFSILLGMTVIMLCGLWDDVVGIDPRAKIAGQLFAAAALAVTNTGVKVAAGVMLPAAKAVGIATTKINGFETIAFSIPLPGSPFGFTEIPVDLVYWVGTAVIAVFVIGACNASNLIDGLDGLLSGTTAIAAGGLLVIALALALVDDGPLDGSRLVLCLALLGACLGFLPHNFNPATIFLGDSGSLLLGYCTIVIVLTLGDTGKTHLVLAGLIIYAIPIIDATLAIFRRKFAGKKITEADDQHLHHILRRALGVKGAVFALYAIGLGFAGLGIALSEGRGRVTYALVLIFAAFIGVMSFKVARRDHIEKQAAAAGRKESAKGRPPSEAEDAGKAELAPTAKEPAGRA